jgi:hypothetical protein
MTQTLERAFAEAAKLSDEEQDLFAAWMLAELESERRWATLFAARLDALERLADEALADFRRGKTRVLEPESL